jgi:hypothetical protein
VKTLADIIVFFEENLGKTAAQVFDENMEEYTYFIRSEALHNLDITESRMKSRLRKLSEGIIAASVKRYLNENFSDDYGEVELNVNDDGVYDRNMQPISALEKIRKSQREIMGLMVSRGMDEFNKGRQLARIIDARIHEFSKDEPSPKDINWKLPIKPTMLEQTEIEIMRLERRLPNLSSEEAKSLAELYAKLRDARKVVN